MKVWHILTGLAVVWIALSVAVLYIDMHFSAEEDDDDTPIGI